MPITALEALENHRYFYFGFQSHPTADQPWQATPMMAYSDNLVEWNEIGSVDEVGSLRDGFVKKIGNAYYVIGTGGFYKTTDFMSFDNLGYLNAGSFKTLWAPEIFQDTAGKYHIVYCAGDADTGQLDDYVADFDPETDQISNQNQRIVFMDGAIDNSWKIDADIAVIDGVYYLTIGGDYMFSSNNYLGPYQKLPVNFAPTPQKYGTQNSTIANWTEGPEVFVDGDAVRLFADQTDGNGLVFRSATRDDLFDWSDTTKTTAPFKMRHGSILVNEKVTAEDTTKLKEPGEFDPTIMIQGLHGKQAVPLTCFEKSSFQYEYEDNQTNQISFVAYDDGSPSFAYIANESVITFNNDYFVIKSIEEDDTGSELYTVTALQYVNSEIGRVRQRNIRQGTLTYTVQDVLNYFLNDPTANPFGFSFRVFGDFDKQQIENLGGASGKEMISKIIETWPGTIVCPQKKMINVFSPETFRKNYQRRIIYKYDSSDMKLTEDSTGIVNQVLCIGATKDDENNGTDNNGEEGGATESLTEGTVQMITGEDNTSTFQADAKKYLGVPYVWGGHNKANPFAGMDCSGFVSQVYHDFGIEIPAYTISMEADFREIPYSEAKAGDVGFYGPHGGTHHICLLLDHNTQIYEPQPGEVCKMASIASYPPDWYGRNDEMQSKINTKKVENVPTATISFHDNYQATTTTTTVDTNQQFYFQPFIVTDERSKEYWGLHPGDDVQDDRFKDPDSMRAYAMKQLQPDPLITVEVTTDSNKMPIKGEQIYLTIPERGTLAANSDTGTQDAFNTIATTVGFTVYPYDPAQGSDITYDNLQASVLHAQQPYNADVKRIEELANAALDRIPQIFYSKQDPSANQTVRNGAIWIKPIESEVSDSGGSNTDITGNNSGTTRNK